MTFWDAGHSMDLSFLDKSSAVTPMLVRLYDSHKLYGLAKDKQPLARAELTSAVSELLEMELSPRESELIADVLIALVRQAERDLKQAIAERLSVIEGVPLRLILQLANDEIDVAGSILKNSPVLGDMDLIYIIKSKGSEYWQSIAARAELSDQVINVLSDTRDFDTALTLVKNKNILLTDHALSILSDIAQGNEVLARPLLTRADVSNEIASKLFEYVGQELKQFILEHYEVNIDVLIDAIDDVILELVDAAPENDFMPTASMLAAAARFKEKGLLTTNLMLGTLKRRQVKAFVAQFSRYTEMEPETVASILAQKNGQGLAVACKAFEIVKPDFITIFLLTNRARHNGRIVDLKDMTRALQYFDKIDVEVAAEIIKNSAGKISEE